MRTTSGKSGRWSRLERPGKWVCFEVGEKVRKGRETVLSNVGNNKLPG